MRDPYEVLGISNDATDEQVKHAYRMLARKYHPDNYTADNPLASLAEEKMKEVNEAYDDIQKMRSAYSNGEPAAFAEIRRLINSSRFADADLILEGMHGEQRGAEWHYLKGIILMRRGWGNDAQREFDQACSMDPNNSEYRRAKDEFIRRNAGFGGAYNRGAGDNTNVGVCGDCCDICSCVLCANCMSNLCCRC